MVSIYDWIWLYYAWFVKDIKDIKDKYNLI